MTTPSLGDLRYLYYGGGSAAEYAYLLDAAARGVSAQDVLEVAESGGGGGGGPASTVAFTPGGTVAATNVQAAIAEVAVESALRGGGAVTLWSGTQAQYDAIGTKVNSTVYVITA